MQVFSLAKGFVIVARRHHVMEGPCRAGLARTAVMSDNMDHVIVGPWPMIYIARPRGGQGGALSGHWVDVARGHVGCRTVRWVDTVDSLADYISQSRKMKLKIKKKNHDRS